tara:strand:- start:605 stop:1438 length:834 start_codon:yes stop_codon:yes gene_type:complete
MKTRHNKKRNTAFVYEALVREITAAIMKQDSARQKKIVEIIKKHFAEDSILRQDLQCHQSLYETKGVDKVTSEKILREARLAHRVLDPHGLFVAQSDLINDINKELEPSVFNAFVPNYKTLASISQMFSLKTSPKDQVLLENEIITSMTATDGEVANVEKVDNLVVKTFVSKFNDKYENRLFEEQKELLSHYISSFADNALQLKVFLNEEISRLKEKLNEATTTPEIKADSEMMEKTNKVVSKLDSFAKESINENVLLTILKTQSLVREIYSDGSND